MSHPRLLLDEHVDRTFERLLRDRGIAVTQSKDTFGEETDDRELLEWCRERDVVFVTNNVKDFARLDEQMEHRGLLCYRDQQLPTADPEGLAITVEEVLRRYSDAGLANHRVELDEWYDWLTE